MNEAAERNSRNRLNQWLLYILLLTMFHKLVMVIAGKMEMKPKFSESCVGHVLKEENTPR